MPSEEGVSRGKGATKVKDDSVEKSPYESSRIDRVPSEKDAMQSELERQVAQLTTPGQASKGEAGAGAGLPTDAATAFLASFAMAALLRTSRRWPRRQS